MVNARLQEDHGGRQADTKVCATDEAPRGELLQAPHAQRWVACQAHHGYGSLLLAN